MLFFNIFRHTYDSNSKLINAYFGMNTLAKKALLLHQQRECLYYKRSVRQFLQNTNCKCRYQLYKKKIRNKIYNKTLCQKYTMIRIPKYNNI